MQEQPCLDISNPSSWSGFSQTSNGLRSSEALLLTASKTGILEEIPSILENLMRALDILPREVCDHTKSGTPFREVRRCQSPSCAGSQHRPLASSVVGPSCLEEAVIVKLIVMWVEMS